MESIDFRASCTYISSASRERKRLFGCCFHPRPGSRLGKISRRVCAFLDQSLAWVLTEVALLPQVNTSGSHKQPNCMQDILPSYKAKNFSDLALLAMQHYRLAFQNRLLVWTTYEIDPYHS